MRSLTVKLRAGVATVASTGLLIGLAGTVPAGAQTAQLTPPSTTVQSAPKSALQTAPQSSTQSAAVKTAAASVQFVAAARPKRATRVNLRLRSGPSLRYRIITVVRRGTVVTLLGPRRGGFNQVAVGNRRGWMATRYLGPVRRASTPSRSVPVSSRSYPSTERRLTTQTIRVHRALRRAFPQIRTVYGYRPGRAGEHRLGRALDVMLPNYRSASSRALGTRIANWSRSNARSLRIMYVIWDQRIWNTQRAGDGWRRMSNGGSDSANHKNHVHISVR